MMKISNGARLSSGARLVCKASKGREPWGLSLCVQAHLAFDHINLQGAINVTYL